ncbi:MAG: TonB-dependent receptor, partial [Lautropia mirabilis]|nr:TonB-dependent receptor [Lautropia mirabilis]
MSSGAALSTALAAEPTALAPLVVTATREAQPITDSAADVVLVSRQMLEDSGLSSVDDALRRFAGLQLARNGGPGQSGGYFLRGVAAGGVVVLLDGVRIGSASLGQTDFGSMNLAQIDHI